MNGPKPPQPDGQPEQVEELEREIERLQAENEGLKKKIEGLEEELRASKRQAAPFSKGRRKANPKRPGRKVGQGIFRHRPAPAEAIGGEIVEAAVPAGCPSCGGALAVEGEEWATTTDLPGSTPTPSHPLPTCRFAVVITQVRHTSKRILKKSTLAKEGRWDGNARR
jgi:hypothetical protein